MKAKIKLKLHEDSFCKRLYMKLKLENEKFYWNKKNIIKDISFNENGYICKTDQEFYSEVIDFVSNIEKIKMEGEMFVREIIVEEFKKANSSSKEKEAKELLKKLKNPIEIEIEV